MAYRPDSSRSLIPHLVGISNVTAAWCMREGELIEIGCYSMVVALCYVHLNDHRHSRRQMREQYFPRWLSRRWQSRGRERAPSTQGLLLMCAAVCVLIYSPRHAPNFHSLLPWSHDDEIHIVFFWVVHNKRTPVNASRVFCVLWETWTLHPAAFLYARGLFQGRGKRWGELFQVNSLCALRWRPARARGPGNTHLCFVIWFCTLHFRLRFLNNMSASERNWPYSCIVVLPISPSYKFRTARNCQIIHTFNFWGI